MNGNQAYKDRMNEPYRDDPRSSYVPQKRTPPLDRAPGQQVDMAKLENSLNGLQERRTRRFNLVNYLMLLWRGKWIILACTFIAAVIAWYYTHSLPFIYQSNLQMLVSDKSQDIAEAGAFGPNPYAWMTPPDRMIKKEMQVMLSKPIFDSVAAILVRRRYLNTAKMDSVIPIVAGAERSWLPRLRGVKDISRDSIEKVLISSISNRIRSTLNIKPSKDGDVLYLTASTGDPYEAALIVTSYADYYVKESERQNRMQATSVKEYVTGQQNMAKDSLHKKEDALRNVQEQSGVLDIKAEGQDMIKSKSSLKEDLDRAQIELSAVQRKLAVQRSQLKEIDENYAEEASQAMPARIKELNDEVARRQVALDQIKINNAPRASDAWYQAQVSKQQRDIDDLKRKLEKENEEYKNSKISALSSREGLDLAGLNELKKRIMEDKIVEGTLQARVAATGGALGEVERKLRSAPKVSQQLTQIGRDVEGYGKIYSDVSEAKMKKDLEEQSLFSNVRVLEPAQVNTAPVSPHHTSNVVVGIVCGLALGIGIVLLIAYADTTVHSPDELERNQFTVLTTIPLIREEHLLVPVQDQRASGPFGNTTKVSPHLITMLNPKSPIAESYRSLRTAIQYASLGDKTRVILLTSSIPQEGKSTTSVNLATVIAQSGQKTILVDCDLRRPTVHSVFSHPKEPGLVNCLVGACTIDEAVCKTPEPNLHILSSGSIPPNPSELLGSRRMLKLLEQLKDKYDIVLLDSPPVGAVTDGVILSTIADITIVVVRAHRTRMEFLEKTREELSRVSSSTMGVVLNDFDIVQSYSYSNYKYYRYYKYYKYYNYYGSNENPDKDPGDRAKAAMDVNNEPSQAGATASAADTGRPAAPTPRSTTARRKEANGNGTKKEPGEPRRSAASKKADTPKAPDPDPGDIPV